MTAPKVYEAINSVMAQMAKEGISKSRKNVQQGYQFRGIDDVYSSLCGVMAVNKLMMLPFVQTIQREERVTQKGGALNYTILTVDFKFVSAEDGSSDTVRMVGEAMDSADKSSNKAQSAALKYAALQVFMIPTEGDNDADATTHDVKGQFCDTPGRPRLSSAEAKRQGLHEAFEEELIKIQDLDALDVFCEHRLPVHKARVPINWLEPMDDKVETHRNTLVDALREFRGTGSADLPRDNNN